VHVVLADGGFDFTGRENFQELLCRQLLLGQMVTALSILRKGGVFLCKVFDTFLPFTVHLLWILRTHFETFSLVKPNQSRPANSERYVVCTGLLEEQPAVIEYLHKVNASMIRNKHALQQVATTAALKAGLGVSDEHKHDRMVTSIVDNQLMQKDVEFIDYVCNFSTGFASRQVSALHRLKKYVEDQQLMSDNGHKVRLQCLTYWQVKEYPPTKALDFDPLVKAYYDNNTPWYIEKNPDLGATILNRQSTPFFKNNQSETWFKNVCLREITSAIGYTPFSSTTEAEKALVYKAMKAQKSTKALDRASLTAGMKQALLMVPPLARPRDWYAHVLPRGGTRYILLSAFHGLYLCGKRKKMEAFPFPDVSLPADTILDVVKVNDVFYVLDAWTMIDELQFFKKRTRFADRVELTGMLIDTVNQRHLRHANPLRLPELLNLPAFRALSSSASSAPVGAPANVPSKDFDIWFSRGNGPKPAPCIEWKWSKAGLADVRSFLKYVLCL
jgi:hypothetical protein